jgi:hypothetical protein
LRKRSLPGADLIIALGMLALDMRTMSGFDISAVDRNAPEDRIKSNLLRCLGYGDPQVLRLRSLFHLFDATAKII